MKYNIGDKVRRKNTKGKETVLITGFEPNGEYNYLVVDKWYRADELEKVEECSKEYFSHRNGYCCCKGHTLKHNPCCDTVECSRCGKVWEAVTDHSCLEELDKVVTTIDHNGTTWTSKDIGESGWSYHHCS